MSLESAAPKKSRVGRRIAVYLVVALAFVGYFFVPAYLRRRANENYLSCRTNLKNINTAVEMYMTDHQGALPSDMASLYPNYLLRAPECPAAGTSTYQLFVGTKAPLNAEKEPAYYYVACMGHNHGDGGPADRPAYSSVQGVIDD